MRGGRPARHPPRMPREGHRASARYAAVARCASAPWGYSRSQQDVRHPRAPKFGIGLDGCVRLQRRHGTCSSGSPPASVRQPIQGLCPEPDGHPTGDQPLSRNRCSAPLPMSTAGLRSPTRTATPGCGPWSTAACPSPSTAIVPARRYSEPRPGLFKILRRLTDRVPGCLRRTTTITCCRRGTSLLARLLPSSPKAFCQPSRLFAARPRPTSCPLSPMPAAQMYAIRDGTTDNWPCSPRTVRAGRG